MILDIILLLGCLTIKFPGTLAAKSAALITYDAGPSADPWMKLALADISNKPDTSPLYPTQCEWTWKKLTYEIVTGQNVSDLA